MEIFRSLKTYEVVVEEAGKQFFCPGHDAEYLGGREGDVKEEPDPARPAELAKLEAKGEEVEVVDPDEVSGFKEVNERGGVLSVYAAVYAVAVMAESSLVGEAVKDWPEGAVGEYVVEAINFVPGKGD